MSSTYNGGMIFSETKIDVKDDKPTFFGGFKKISLGDGIKHSVTFTTRFVNSSITILSVEECARRDNRDKFKNNK